ncbi:MAG: hypothetical protein LH647_04685 [Leptolyngbyaceae cyanobacterium CAN_BIN12]|nr:hypothetical protein [Leptolyngbyaceae cyanobacterium CAN_BIN12]
MFGSNREVIRSSYGKSIDILLQMAQVSELPRVAIDYHKMLRSYDTLG